MKRARRRLGRRQEVVDGDAHRGQRGELDSLATAGHHDATVATLLDGGITADLDALVTQVDDPVLRNARRRVDRRFGQSVPLQQLHLVVGAEHSLVDEPEELLGRPAGGDGRSAGAGRAIDRGT